MKQLARFKYDLFLLTATFLWGSSFLATEYSLKQVDLMTLIGYRYAIATVVMLLLFGRYLKHYTPKALRNGLFLGLFLFAGTLLQTGGQLFTTPEKSAFIISMQVLVVPFISFLFLKKTPSAFSLVGVCLAFVGMFLVNVGSSITGLFGGWGIGETITLGCALIFGTHIIFSSKFTQETNPLFLCIIQLATVAVLSNITAAVLGDRPVPATLDVWLPLLYTGIFATAGALSLMLIGQKHIPPTRAAVIYSMEPVFAFITGMIIPSFDGTYATSNLPTLIGGGTIILGILVSEIGPDIFKSRSADT